MSVLTDSVALAHTRSGRFVQRERPAADIPARIRARRLTLQAQRIMAAQERAEPRSTEYTSVPFFGRPCRSPRPALDPGSRVESLY